MRSILTALQEGRLFELPANEKAEALEFLARILDANPDIDVGTDAIEEIKRREREYNTGIGLGVGVPHVRAKREDGELFCAIGFSQHGIDYGAADGEPVHLVFMYYIPGALKNVYLKEVSSLVKAIKQSGGIKPITQTDNLNVVRNLLLDWVSEGLGETGPEAVARMIKLEVKQAQGAVPVPFKPGEPSAFPGRPISRVMTFTVLILPPNGVVVLADDPQWVSILEKESGLGERLSVGVPLTIASRLVFVTATTAYPAGRVLYQCVALTT